nr:DNAse I-like superfamily protein [Tanacetum cinerariifolium]
MEDIIEYNDLTQMMLYDLTRIELLRKALDTNNKGHGQNSKDHGLPYFWLKRDNVGIMAAFKFKKPCQHYVIVANSHLYWPKSSYTIFLCSSQIKNKTQEAYLSQELSLGFNEFGSGETDEMKFIKALSNCSKLEMLDISGNNLRRLLPEPPEILSWSEIKDSERSLR